MRTIATAALTLTATLALGACQQAASAGPSAPKASTTSPQSQKSSTTTTTPAPTTTTTKSRTTPKSPATPSAPQTHGGSTSSAPTAPSTGRVDKSIRTFDFKNTTWTATDGRRVTMTNGQAQITVADGATRYYNVSPTWSPAPQFADLDHDGYEDALVILEEGEGNGYTDTIFVWFGGPNGPKQLANSVLPQGGRCATKLISVKVTPRGTIVVSGARYSENQACADYPNQPFTRYFTVKNGTVHEVLGK